MGWDKLLGIGFSTALKIVQRSSSPTADKKHFRSLIAFVCFSSLYIFMWPLKLPSPEKAKLHWSHKFDFSPLCGLNVSSSRLYKRKQSRTGCICMTCMGWDKLSVIGVSIHRSKDCSTVIVAHSGEKTLPVIVRICLFFFTTHVHVCPQIAFPRKFKVALITQVWLFSTVRFKIFLPSACKRENKVALAAFVWLFLQCVFLNVFSNRQLKRMWSHIGGT